MIIFNLILFQIKSGVPTKEELIDLNSLLLQDRVAYVQ